MSDTTNMNENTIPAGNTPENTPQTDTTPGEHTISNQNDKPDWLTNPERQEHVPYGTNTTDPEPVRAEPETTENKEHSTDTPQSPYAAAQPQYNQTPDQPYNYPTTPNQPPYGGAVYGPPPTYGTQPNPYNGYVPQKPYNKMAIASISAGVSQIFLFFLIIPAFLAVIFGHIGLNQIKKTGEQGKGLAITGLVLGYAGVAFTLLWFLIIIVAMAGSTGY